MRINAEWHAKNPMPPSPTVEQRIVWHLEHAVRCGCRPIPPKLQAEIRKRKPGSHRRRQ